MSTGCTTLSRSASPTDQTRGVGTEFLCDTKVGPIKLVDRMEITEWVPGEAMGVRHTGVVTGTGRFTLDPDRSRSAHPVHLGRRSLTFPWWLGGPSARGSAASSCSGAIWRRNLREPAPPRRAD